MVSLAYLKKIPAGFRGKVKFTRENGILWSVYVLVFLLALLLLVDGFLFYMTVFSSEKDLPPVPELVDFSGKEIDEMLEILNARQEKFEEILAR